jgi:microcystin degradation protein MlrC
MSFRVGVIALQHESNTFLPQPTTLEHFRRDVLLHGQKVREFFQAAYHEVGGFFAQLADEQIEAVPMFAARTIPYGAFTPECVTGLMDQLHDSLENAGNLDGLLVAPHGAAVSQPYPDFDGYWLTAVRQQFGPTRPIIGTLDPHANLSPAMVTATNALFAYRTNPHIDQRDRGREAAALMARTLRGEVRPVQAAAYPPMAINIERQCTAEEPLATYTRTLDHARQQPGILGVSLILGFPYSDVAKMGSSLLVVTDDQHNLAQHNLAQVTANRLAAQLWDRREPLAGTFLSVADAVTQAAGMAGPICLLDMGDNVGGGSPADGTWIAQEVHRRRVGPALVIIYDPESVAAAEAAGAGSRQTFHIGGKHDALHGSPLVADFTVRSVTDGLFHESEPRHGGFTEFDQGRTAILQADSGLTVMLTSRRAPPFSLSQLTTFGVDPTQYHLLIAKGVNAPLAAYQPVCRHILRVNTPGVTTADMTQLEFHHRPRPMFPFERETTWSPQGT